MTNRTKEQQEIVDSLFDPAFDAGEAPAGHWLILLLPTTPKTIGKGKFILPETTRGQVVYTCVVGKVIAMGDEAYRPTELKEYAGSFCELGDIVRFPSMMGDKFSKGEETYIYIKDSEIMGTFHEYDRLVFDITGNR